MGNKPCPLHDNKSGTVELALPISVRHSPPIGRALAHGVKSARPLLMAAGSNKVPGSAGQGAGQRRYSTPSSSSDGGVE
jgi:hypothetical protein